MTAYSVCDKFEPIDSNGQTLVVNQGQFVSSSQGMIVVAGVTEQGNASSFKVSDLGLKVDVAQPTQYQCSRYESTSNGGYYALIDVSNISGSYLHTSSSGVILRRLNVTIDREKTIDRWNVKMGVVLSISELSASVGWLQVGSYRMYDTVSMNIRNSEVFSSEKLSLNVVSGTFRDISSNYVETINVLSSSTYLSDVKGKLINPEVGDVLLNVERLTGVGSLSFHYHMWYNVE